MKALLCKQHGLPDTLVYEDTADPVPGPGQVVVDMHAAGANFPDVLIIQNKYQFKPALPFSPGSELAGIVSAVGDGVGHTKVGDRVIASSGHGAFAEKVLVQAARIIPLPEGVSFEVGAAFTLTYGTSYHAIKDRVQADYTGMLGTVMNALVMADSLKQLGVDTRVQTAIAMQSVAEPYIRGRALRHLEKGRIVIFGAGIGSPYFSTDTTAALRAAEIEADAILMAKNGVDGVYNADPKKDANAVKFNELTHREVISRGLKIMDATASTLSMDNDIDLVVFNMNEPGNIKRVVFGEPIGTTVSNYTAEK